MAQIKSGSTKHLCFLSGLFAGLLIGSALLTILISYRMDKYYQRVKQLEMIIEEKNIYLQKLEESVHQTKFILKSITVFLLYDGDDLDKLNLERWIKEKYRHLLGKEINSMDPELIAEVIDKRLLKLNEKEYILKLNKLILAEDLKIWVHVTRV